MSEQGKVEMVFTTELFHIALENLYGLPIEDVLNSLTQEELDIEYLYISEEFEAQISVMDVSAGDYDIWNSDSDQEFDSDHGFDDVEVLCCELGWECRDVDCNKYHCMPTPVQVTEHEEKKVAKPKKSDTDCRNGVECWKKNCKYRHPPNRSAHIQQKEIKKCRKGSECEREDCWFGHPAGWRSGGTN